MKIKQITARYSKKMAYAPFLNQDVGFDITFEPTSETDMEDFKGLADQLKARISELKTIAEEWHESEMNIAKAKNQKHNAPIDYEQSGVVIKKSEGEHLATLPQKPTKPLTKEESIIVDMNTSPDIKALEAYRLIAKSNKLLQDAYDIKMKSLKSKK